MDAEYLDAVKAGDMTKAQELVNKAAEVAGYTFGSDYQGSRAFNGVAPSSNGYFETREERKEAFENGKFAEAGIAGELVVPDDVVSVKGNFTGFSISSIDIVEFGYAVADNVSESFFNAGDTYV